MSSAPAFTERGEAVAPGWKLGAAGASLAFLLRLWSRTLRFRFLHREREEEILRRGESLIYAFWHNHFFALPYLCAARRMHILLSRSRDGELLVQTLKRLCPHVLFVRGSAMIPGGRDKGGATALRAMARLLAEGSCAGVTPDGPKGPRHCVQPGVILLASLSGAPILPVAVCAKGRFVFSSWDRFEVPHPFSRTVVACGEPQWVPRELGPDQLEEHRSLLEGRLCALGEEAAEAARWGPRARP
ncbi:MAG: lysophospholipid acyltransferase family protein [Nitrospinota bacterium]